MMSQIDELNHLRAQIQAEQEAQHISKEEQKQTQKELKEFIEKEDVKENLEKLDAAKKKLKESSDKIAELEAKNPQIKQQAEQSQGENPTMNSTDASAQQSEQPFGGIPMANSTDAAQEFEQQKRQELYDIIAYHKAQQDKSEAMRDIWETTAKFAESVDDFAAEHPNFSKYSGQFLEWSGYAIQAVVLYAAAQTGPVAFVTTGLTMSAQEKLFAATIEHSMEALVENAASHGRTEEESLRFAHGALRTIEIGLAGAGALGLFKLIKNGPALMSKCASLKANLRQWVHEVFARTQTNRANFEQQNAQRLFETLYGNFQHNNKSDVSATKIGLNWNGPALGDQGYGMAFENYIATLPEFSRFRLPKNFQTFDFWNRRTGKAVSVKTLDTNKRTYLLHPNNVYNKIKGYVDETLNFTRYDKGLKPDEVNASMIRSRELQLGIPSNTGANQWAEVQRGVEYGRLRNVKVLITRIGK